MKRLSLRVAGLSIVFSVLVVWPPIVLAQEIRAEVPGYREAVAEALSEFDQQNYLEARRHFVRAHQILPSARTLRGLGAVSYELRRYGDAVTFLRQALTATVKPLDSEMRMETERLLARSRELVGELTLDVSPHSATVTIDGAAAQPLPEAPVLLDVGPHQLDFEAVGCLPRHRSWLVEGGESETWSISLSGDKSETEAPSSGSTKSHTNRWAFTTSAIALAVGVASTIAAGVATVERHTKGEELRAVSSLQPSYSQLVEEWQDTRPKPYILGALGAVALSGGALGLLLSASRESFPLWGSILSGAVGIGLTSWGIVEVTRGDSCEVATAVLSHCSAALERRDRGALVLMSASPFLALPLAQLMRRVWGTGASSDTKIAIGGQIGSRRQLASVDIRLVW